MDNEQFNEEEIVLTEVSEEVIEEQAPKQTELDLNTIDEKDRDPEVENFAQSFKLVYENQFRDYLKQMIKKQSISATSLPTVKYCKENYEAYSMNSTTLLFYFDHLEQDECGNINSVVATTFDQSESCHFIPEICNQYGPYVNTTLFTCLYNVGRTSSNNNPDKFFLDLPIELYNLIEDE